MRLSAERGLVKLRHEALIKPVKRKRKTPAPETAGRRRGASADAWDRMAWRSAPACSPARPTRHTPWKSHQTPVKIAGHSFSKNFFCILFNTLQLFARISRIAAFNN